MKSHIAWIGLAGLLACSAQAQVTSQWNQTTLGPHDWTDPANWDNGVPNGVDHVAQVDNSSAGNVNQGINLGANITLGRMDWANAWNAYRTIAPNGGSLIFQTSTGDAVLNHASYFRLDTLSAPVTLNQNLLLNAYGRSHYGYGTSVEADGHGLYITGAIGGTGGITKTGPYMVWLMNTGNTFSGPLAIEQGWVYAKALGSLGSSAAAIPMGSTGWLGGLFWGGSENFTREIVLEGTGARLAPYTALNLENIISGSGALVILRGRDADTRWVNFNNAADNTYTGPTIVSGGQLAANVANRVITGDATVRDGGRLTLANANNVGGTVDLQSRNVLGAPVVHLPSYVRVNSDFVPNFTAESSGAFEWVGTSGANINAALAAGPLGNGYVTYGGGGSYTGSSLAPNVDDVYRFTLQNARGMFESSALTITGSVLTGDRSVIVSAPSLPWGTRAGPSRLILHGTANTFTGSLTIHPGANVVGYSRANPFGHTDGAVHIAGSQLSISGLSGGVPVQKGDLTIRGHVFLSIDATTAIHQTDLEFASLTRLDRATLGVRGSRDKLGAEETVTIVTGAPVNDAQGMLAPWMVDYGSTAFLSYGASGFEKTVFTSTDLSTAGATDIVDVGSAAVSGAKTVHALRTTGALTSAGAGDVLTLASGGLILAGDAITAHSANIAFGAAEGVIHRDRREHTLTGKLTGSNGLTLSGWFTGNPSPHTYFAPSEAWELTGTLTINQGHVGLNANALAGFTDIVINGSRPIRDSNHQTSSLIPWGGALTIPDTVTITVGPEGGAVGTRFASGGDLTIDGRITGGTLMLYSEHSGRSMTINSALNDYTGGTLVAGGPIYAGTDATLGTGDVIISSATVNKRSQLHLRGANNIHDQAHVILADLADGDATGLIIETATQTIGSLEGNGRVFFDQSGGSVLTLGGNNASTDFYGTLSDYATAVGRTNRRGALVKTGSGTFTLWGEGRHSDGTTVNEGTFMLHGALEEDVLVATAGTLAGTGLAVANVMIEGGTLAPGPASETGTLTVGGDVTLDAASTLAIGLAGNGGSSLLAVGGAVTLAGTLEITLHEGSSPSPGSQYTIVTADGEISGTFDTVPDGARVSIEGATVLLEFPPQGTVILLR